jgi:hypothetical protein
VPELRLPLTKEVNLAKVFPKCEERARQMLDKGTQLRAVLQQALQQGSAPAVVAAADEYLPFAIGLMHSLEAPGEGDMLSLTCAFPWTSPASRKGLSPPAQRLAASFARAARARGAARDAEICPWARTSTAHVC